MAGPSAAPCVLAWAAKPRSRTQDPCQGPGSARKSGSGCSAVSTRRRPAPRIRVPHARVRAFGTRAVPAMKRGPCRGYRCPSGRQGTAFRRAVPLRWLRWRPASCVTPCRATGRIPPLPLRVRRAGGAPRGELSPHPEEFSVRRIGASCLRKSFRPPAATSPRCWHRPGRFAPRFALSRCFAARPRVCPRRPAAAGRYAHLPHFIVAACPALGRHQEQSQNFFEGASHGWDLKKSLRFFLTPTQAQPGATMK